MGLMVDTPVPPSVDRPTHDASSPSVSTISVVPAGSVGTGVEASPDSVTITAGTNLGGSSADAGATRPSHGAKYTAGWR